MDKYDDKATELTDRWPNLCMECDEETLLDNIAQALRDAYSSGYYMGAKKREYELLYQTYQIRNGHTGSCPPECDCDFARQKKGTP